MRKLILGLILLLSVSLVLAQNDPGHDTLYIEQQGDSELNGTFNVTQNQTIRGGLLEINNSFQLRGDGGNPGTNINFITASLDNWIAINSLGNGEVVRLQDQVAGGLVHVGHGSNTGSLNVSDSVYILGPLLRMDTNFEIITNGSIPSTTTNSIVVNGTSSTRRMWLTSQQVYIAAGTTNGIVFIGDLTQSDEVDLNISGVAYANNSQICTVANGLCGAGGSNVSGTGNTGFLARWTAATVIGDSVVYDDGTNVGIGTTNPAGPLHIFGSDNITPPHFYIEGQQNSSSDVDIRFRRSRGGNLIQTEDSLGGIDFWGYNGTNFIESAGIVGFAEGTLTGNIIPGRLSFFTMNGTGAFGERMRITSNGTVGINITSPSHALTVRGGGNFTSAVFIAGSQVCTPGNGLCGGASGGGGGWTNTSTLTSTNLNVNITGGILTQYASGTPGISGGLNLDEDAFSVYVQGRYAYIGMDDNAGDEFRIIDITDPTNPTNVGGIEYGNSVDSLYVAGKYAYISRAWVGGDDFRIIDISNPANPVTVGGVDFGTSETTNDMYISGRYAYLVDTSDNLRIIDIFDPANPVEVGSYTLVDNGLTVYVQGEYAYLGDGTASSSNNLTIINISDPTNPVLAGVVGVGAAIEDVYVSGKYAYIARGVGSGGEFQIINVSDVSNPSVVGSGELASNTYSVYVAGRYAYIGTDNITIFDVSDPTSPVNVGMVSLSNRVVSTMVSGKYLYAARWNTTGNEFQIIDLHGSDLPAASIGSVSVGTLSVAENAVFANDVYVGNGIVTGSGGIKTDGSLAVANDTYIRGVLNVSDVGFIAGSQICTPGNGLCGGAGGGGGGWSNTTTTTNTNLNVNITGNLTIYNETGSTMLFFNTSTGNLNLTNNLTVSGGGIYDSGGVSRLSFSGNRVIITLG